MSDPKNVQEKLAALGASVASDVDEVMQQARRHRLNAEQFIQRKPLNSVLIAAGTGALTALAVSWLLRSRKC